MYVEQPLAPPGSAKYCPAKKILFQYTLVQYTPNDLGSCWIECETFTRTIRVRLPPTHVSTDYGEGVNTQSPQLMAYPRRHTEAYLFIQVCLLEMGILHFNKVVTFYPLYVTQESRI